MAACLFLKQLYVQPLIRGFPDARPALRSLNTRLSNDLGMETGPGILDREPLVCVALSSIGVDGLFKAVKVILVALT